MFDPNTVTLYGWYPGYGEVFKVYTTRGPALGRLSANDRNGSAVFELKDGKWEEIARVNRPNVCERCGGNDWLERSYHEQKLPKYERTYLCYPCRQAESKDPFLRRFR